VSLTEDFIWPDWPDWPDRPDWPQVSTIAPTAPIQLTVPNCTKSSLLPKTQITYPKSAKLPHIALLPQTQIICPNCPKSANLPRIKNHFNCPKSFQHKSAHSPLYIFVFKRTKRNI
jgi:hypothetical protein